MVLDRVTDELISIFEDAMRVAVLTGAGISAESGVPTFRGGGGTDVWTWRGKHITELSSAELMATDPALVWEWFDYRRGMLKSVAPNAGHYALADWEKRFSPFTLITQNIDDLHRAAGSQNVLELHGNIWKARCLRCASVFDARESPLEKNPPTCMVCGAAARPDVVLFGELLPETVFERADKAAHQCDLFFVIGTSAVVYPAAGLPISAKQCGAKIIEVNPELTDISMMADYTILGKAGEVLPRFLRNRA